MESAKQYEDELDKAEIVERDRVDKALTEKLDLTRKFAQERKGEVCLGLPPSVQGIPSVYVFTIHCP